MKNALFASDCYIVPARLDYLSMLGIYRLEDNVNRFKDECKKHIETLINAFGECQYEPPELSLLGVVPMMVDIVKGDEAVAAQQEYLEEMKKNYYIFHYVRNNGSIFGVSPEDGGVPVVLQHPKFSLTAKKIVKELKNLGDEFLRKVESLDSHI